MGELLINKELKRSYDFMTKQGLTVISRYCKGTYDKEKNKMSKDKKVNCIERKGITLKSSFNNKCNALVVLTGDNYDTIAIDIDNKGDSIVNFHKLTDAYPDIWETCWELSMNGGYHFYFTVDELQKKRLKKLKNSTAELWKDKGVDADIKFNTNLITGPVICTDKNITKKSQICYFGNVEPLPDNICEDIEKYCLGKKRTHEIKILQGDGEYLIKQPKKIDNEPINPSTDNEPVIINPSTDNDEKLKKYIDLLNVSRFESHEGLFKIGQIIKNSGGTHEYFISIAKKTGKENRMVDAVNNWQYYIVGKGHTISALKKMAQEDSPETYDKECETDDLIINLFRKGINDVLMGLIFYRNFKNDFKYAIDIGKGGSYFYNNKYGIWKQDFQNIEFMKKINELYEILHEESEKYKESLDKLGTNEGLDELNLFKLKKWAGISAYLKDIIKQKRIIETVKIYYGEERLLSKFDEINLKLFAFDNGVVDLETRKFRKAKPEELVYFTCGRNYKKFNEDDNEELLDELEKIGLSIFDTKEESDFMWLFHGLGLSKTNRHQLIMCEIGKGGNGKGIFGQLMCKAYGNYAQEKLSADYITIHKNTSKQTHDSTMAGLKNKLYVIIPEVEEKPVDGGIIKDMSGGGKQSATKKFENDAVEFKPKFIVHLQTNVKPQFGGKIDDAIKRRLLMKYYRNKFVKNPTLPFHRQADENLEERINNEEFTDAVFHIILNKYYDYVDNGKQLIIPKQIRKDTNDFFKQEDCIKSFIEETLIKITNEDELKPKDMTLEKYKLENKIGATELYNSFKSNFKGDKFDIMSEKKFSQRLTDIKDDYELVKIGTGKHKKYYTGYRYPTEDEKEPSDDAINEEE